MRVIVPPQSASVRVQMPACLWFPSSSPQIVVAICIQHIPFCAPAQALFCTIFGQQKRRPGRSPKAASRFQVGTASEETAQWNEYARVSTARQGVYALGVLARTLFKSNSSHSLGDPGADPEGAASFKY